jgi:hypothetical protein
LTRLEKDGSIAWIRTEHPAGIQSDDAARLYTVVDAISPRNGEHYVETAWDDRGNWTEKRECYKPHDGEALVQFVYRREIAYR